MASSDDEFVDAEDCANNPTGSCQIPQNVKDINNGNFLLNVFFPEEVLANILIFVDWKDLLSCRLVCHTWKRLTDLVVGFAKLKQFCKPALHSSFTGPVSNLSLESVPFYLYFSINKGAFGENHLKNPFGSGCNPGGSSHTCRRPDYNTLRELARGSAQSSYINKTLCSDSNCPKYKHWRVTRSGGDGWEVEPEPVGSEPLPGNLGGHSCFVTSFNWAHKEQLITLVQCGLSAKIMDEIQPHFKVSEWYARRWDCGMTYKLKVSLLDSKQHAVKEFEKQAGENLQDNKWHQISHTFKGYGPGVRYILFEHSGKDTQFWAGHYGSKMAGGSVIAQIPSSLFEKPK